jgi:hypothetical protein
VIVSHDLNLIRHVDRVLVISAGRVLEEGSPADLLANGGLYAELYAAQFGEALAVESPAAEAERSLAELAAELELVDTAPMEGEAFGSALTRAMPLPATQEQFRALTGWIERPPVPAPRVPSPGEVDLDPLRSPALGQAVPGLAEALTGSAMSPRLQGMLADDWELLACSPGKVCVAPGEGVTLQYRLELRRRGGFETVEHRVAGRLFRTVEAAEGWLSSVDPLADQLEGRADLRAFARPSLLVRELGLVLHALPLDPALPGLVLATDPSELVEMLGPAVTGAVPGLLLDGCHAEVVTYGRGSCVLRYELAWRLQSSRRSLKQVMYGRVYADGRGRFIGPAVNALRQLLHDGQGTSLPFLVPRFQAYLPDLRLALLDAVPGSPLVPALVRARAGVSVPPLPTGPTAEEAVLACARIAAALHRTSIPVGPPRTAAEEIGRVRAAVEGLAPLAPTVAATLRRHLASVGDLAVDPQRLGVAHGDLVPRRVLFDGPTTSLVDFHAVCLAEPALDLGQFTAHLAVAVRKAQDAAGVTPARGEDLSSAFLREYLRLSDGDDPDLLLGRAAAHRTVALTRLAVRSWCQVKPERLRSTLALLDETHRIHTP